jgi:hypothetical protein
VETIADLQHSQAVKPRRIMPEGRRINPDNASKMAMLRWSARKEPEVKTPLCADNAGNMRQTHTSEIELEIKQLNKLLAVASEGELATGRDKDGWAIMASPRDIASLVKAKRDLMETLFWLTGHERPGVRRSKKASRELPSESNLPSPE